MKIVLVNRDFSKYSTLTVHVNVVNANQCYLLTISFHAKTVCALLCLFKAYTVYWQSVCAMCQTKWLTNPADFSCSFLLHSDVPGWSAAMNNLFRALLACLVWGIYFSIVCRQNLCYCSGLFLWLSCFLYARTSQQVQETSRKALFIATFSFFFFFP